MDYAVALAGLAVVHLLAVASPGPSTVLVIQTAAVSGRRAGLLAAFAMMLGALVWAAAALYGLQVLFARFDWLYVAFRVAGALYLLYLAFMLIRHAGAPLPEADPSAVRAGAWQGFVKALLLQLSNPKVMVFMGSIFISLLPAQPPAWMDATVLAIVAANEFVWFALLALLFSGGAARAFYRRAKLWLDRLMGGVLGLLGVRLLASEI
ncbi:MAG: LysE family transporter [Reyranella sp.]|nr:LysE family transporter [Reyranella sp.]MDP3162209.1 LysE family transporter [Reyranella sp.]